MPRPKPGNILQGKVDSNSPTGGKHVDRTGTGVGDVKPVQMGIIQNKIGARAYGKIRLTLQHGVRGRVDGDQRPISLREHVHPLIVRPRNRPYRNIADRNRCDG